MKATAPDLWKLTRGRPQIDPHDLAEAVAAEAAGTDLDYRTRMLIRDSVEALKHYWGAARVENWLEHCQEHDRIEAICGEQFDKVGFPSLKRRIIKKTDPEDVRQYLQELGSELGRPVKIFGLHLGHFQSRYLPMGWEGRVHSLAPFGRLQVYLVDRYDVFLSKLFSKRDKDRDDLRELKQQLDKEALIHKLRDHAQGFLKTPELLELAQKNWQILFGEPLPT